MKIFITAALIGLLSSFIISAFVLETSIFLWMAGTMILSFLVGGIIGSLKRKTEIITKEVIKEVPKEVIKEVPVYVELSEITNASEIDVKETKVVKAPKLSKEKKKKAISAGRTKQS